MNNVMEGLRGIAKDWKKGCGNATRVAVAMDLLPALLDVVDAANVLRAEGWVNPPTAYANLFAALEHLDSEGGDVDDTA